MKKDERDKFLDLIPPAAKRILDVGCADGVLGSRLKDRGIEVVGIEKNKEAALVASKKLDKVFSEDLENFRSSFPDGYFDVILYADVLEHLTDPLRILKEHKKYLSKDGFILASIPNVRYYKVILRLILGGTWDYVDAGILDKTHLRFFTITNMRELFNGAGFETVEIRRNIVSARGFKVLNFFCFNLLKDFLTYQYYIKAKKMSDDSAVMQTKRKVMQF